MSHLSFYFNPRSDERSDVLRHHPANATSISIHAPTNGATIILVCLLSSACYFNPRSDERSDYICAQGERTKEDFNPRSDERSDILFCSNSKFVCNFNPRSDERSDDGQGLCCIEIQQFQSTLRRTERRGKWNDILYKRIFQSTLRRTERPFYSLLPAICANFNPRSDERSDIEWVAVSVKIIKFQSTLRRTERPESYRLNSTTILISIHAPTNGATSVYIVYIHIAIDFNPRSDERSD